MTEEELNALERQAKTYGARGVTVQDVLALIAEARRLQKALAEVRSALGLELRKLQERANVQEAKIGTLTATVERLRAGFEAACKDQGNLARQLRDAQARADRLSVELLKAEAKQT